MASRKEEKDRLRAEREARERAADSAAQRKKLVGYGLGGLLVLAAVVAIVFVVIGGGGNPAPSANGEDGPVAAPPSTRTIPAPNPELVGDLEAAAEAANCTLASNPEEGNDHIEPDVDVTYKANPPTSGDHLLVPAEDGAYTTAPDTRSLVHSLEHGRIVMQYSPDAGAEVSDQLQALFDEDPYHMVLVPNQTDMPFDVAATMWNESIGCEQMNDEVFDALRAFRDQFRDTGPENVP